MRAFTAEMVLILTVASLSFGADMGEIKCGETQRGQITAGTQEDTWTFEGQAGFYDGASARVLDMVLGRDVSVPPEESVPAAALSTSTARVAFSGWTSKSTSLMGLIPPSG